MEVKDVFQLRKEGRIQEAYDAIRPMYAVHKGKYTTICMFWVGHDMLHLLLEQNRTDEALPIFRALSKVLVAMDDQDNKGHKALLWDAVTIADKVASFNMLGFLKFYGVENITTDDWLMDKVNGQLRPSLAERLISRAYKQIKNNTDYDLALMFVPLLEAMHKYRPNRRNTRLYQARIYMIMGEKEKARKIYDDVLGKKKPSRR